MWTDDNLRKRPYKCLVFSYSLVGLDILEIALDEERSIPVLRYDGTTTPEKRSDMEKEFQNKDSKYRVMLVQSSAGGVGSNFTAAASLLFLTPEWSSAKEAQMASRAHRLGQTEDVIVTRLISPVSMDERVREVQGTKTAKEKFLLDLDAEENGAEAIEKEAKEKVVKAKAVKARGDKEKEAKRVKEVSMALKRKQWSFDNFSLEAS
ncbi:hypothetical protein OIDMADRAFT_116211 [Oidiodendron maius Zn]|uniref:Helicase C-terminal domain-containing protein n=1 Tax=Oidiodendron maius (strain Zn) TaxID=913774 RepID=A0A0C3H8U9_OIDMZ|nr:hypothetical protein OIDMADRAFT_116211 [Oidiodendron maius Zn]